MKETITVCSVVNASRGELLCITYELLLERIKSAGQKEGKERKIESKKAIEIIQMLVADLDFEIEISKELFKIYVYVQGLLIQSKTSEGFEEAYKLIEKLYTAFKEITEREEQSKPSMQNAEVIYAGMTYGRNNLNEISLESNRRGFEA
ncbi:flagellar protein FliS [Cellulosilyticum ruminicola]|uniref:flagellar protein FliS n=1 Tax=Cellulosilyticum ruminicola TaxID=425254 RepID=UPI0006D2590D|nr:flagellar export chaperone FliS [Cellulosilyticum ruminicola]